MHLKKRSKRGPIRNNKKELDGSLFSKASERVSTSLSTFLFKRWWPREKFIPVYHAATPAQPLQSVMQFYSLTKCKISSEQRSTNVKNKKIKETETELWKFYQKMQIMTKNQRTKRTLYSTHATTSVNMQLHRGDKLMLSVLPNYKGRKPPRNKTRSTGYAKCKRIATRHNNIGYVCTILEESREAA